MWVEKDVITFEEWPTFEDRPAGNESVAWLKTGKRKVVTGADYSNSSTPIGGIIKDAFAFVKLVNSNFDGTKFCGVANFSGSTFSNGNTFDNALFFNKTDFTGARFASDALFSKATFYREVVFDTTKFDGRALFKGAVFSSSEQQLQFKDALFCTGADFCNADVKGITEYWYRLYHTIKRWVKQRRCIGKVKKIKNTKPEPCRRYLLTRHSCVEYSKSEIFRKDSSIKY